jgi:HK97 family phage prohead protease
MDLLEQRDLPIEALEIRDTDGGVPAARGVVAPFGKLSEDLGGFREGIKRGAFKRSIEENKIYALWQHRPDEPIGHTHNGRLRLQETSTGLEFEIPAHAFTTRQLELLQTGTVSHMSFGFVTRKDEWDEEQAIRTLLDVDLREVSPVTWPAYTDTTVALRHLERMRGGNPKRSPIVETRGDSLAAFLNRQIGDGDDRDAKIARMASAAGISVSTVGQILRGEIECPPIARLRGFARALSVSLDSIVGAAERDGCSYEGSEGREVWNAIEMLSRKLDALR